jgi:hypothetical protein
VNRRDFLAVGGFALAASLSGCISLVPFIGGPPEVREGSGDSLDRRVPTVVPDLSVDPTVAALAVGRGSNHHQVWVWNEIGRRRAFEIEIGGSTDTDPWFSRSYDLNADTNLAIDLRESRAYAITVRVDGRAETVEVPESRFDCNDSATDVVVREDEIKTSSIRTDIGCGGP